MAFGFSLYALSNMHTFFEKFISIRSKSENVVRLSLEELDMTIRKYLKEIESDIKGEKELNNPKTGKTQLLNSRTQGLRIKNVVEDYRSKIIMNSRFHFLFLGVQSLLILILAGFQRPYHEISNLPSYMQEAMGVAELDLALKASAHGILVSHYLAGFLLAVNVSFLILHAGLIFFKIQESPEDIVLHKIAAIIVVVLGLGYCIGHHNSIQQWFSLNNFTILLSIFCVLLPVILLYFRHFQINRFVKSKKFENEIKQIQDKVETTRAMMEAESD